MKATKTGDERGGKNVGRDGEGLDEEKGRAGRREGREEGMADQGVEEKGWAGEKEVAGAEKIRMRAGDNNNEAGDGKDGRKEQLSRGEKNGAPELGRVGFPSSEKDLAGSWTGLGEWKVGPRGPAPTALRGLPSRASQSDAWRMPALTARGPEKTRRSRLGRRRPLIGRAPIGAGAN